MTQHLYSPWNSPGQNTEVGSLSLLQGIFLTQGANPGLPNCRQIPYQLSHKGSPRTLEWVTCLFSSGFARPRNLPELGSPALQGGSLPAEPPGKEQVEQYSMPGRGLKAGAPGFEVQVSNSAAPSSLYAYLPWNKPLQGTLEICKLNQITHILKHPQSFLCPLE